MAGICQSVFSISGRKGCHHVGGRGPTGGSLGPLFYALSSMAITRNLKSPLKVFYLDDAFIAGDPDSVREDFDSIKEVSKFLLASTKPFKM